MARKGKITAEWVDHYYNGPLLSMKTEYWPPGEECLCKYNPEGQKKVSKVVNDKPSAYSIIMFHLKIAGWDNYSVLAEQYFEAETKENVLKQVVEWADEKYKDIIVALEQKFGIELITWNSELKDN